MYIYIYCIACILEILIELRSFNINSIENCVNMIFFLNLQFYDNLCTVIIIKDIKCKNKQ